MLTNDSQKEILKNRSELQVQARKKVMKINTIYHLVYLYTNNVCPNVR